LRRSAKEKMDEINAIDDLLEEKLKELKDSRRQRQILILNDGKLVCYLLLVNLIVTTHFTERKKNSMALYHVYFHKI
jgi:hypothetical protein